MSDWVLAFGAFGFAWILGVFVFVHVSLYADDLHTPTTTGDLDLDCLVEKTLEMRKRAEYQ